MEPPEVLSGGPEHEQRERRKAPPWLRRVGVAVAAVVVLAAVGRPLLDPGPGPGGRAEREAATRDPADRDRTGEEPGGRGPLAREEAGPPVRALAPVQKAADDPAPPPFVGRIDDPSGIAPYRYVRHGGGRLRPLTVPPGAVTPSDDGRDLLVAVDGDRLYAVPLPADGSGTAAPPSTRRIGAAASVLGSRGDRVFVTPDVAVGSPVQVRSRADGRLLDGRYLAPGPGTVAVGVVDSGATAAVILRTGTSARDPAKLVLRWPGGDAGEVTLTRAGRFLGSQGGVAVVAPAPGECGYPPRRCLLVVRPGTFRVLRGGVVYAPPGWSPDISAPVAFAAGGVVFGVGDGRGTRALAVAWPGSLRARLVPGSLDATPAYGLAADGPRVLWAVRVARGPVVVAPVVWDASRPAEPGRYTGGPALPAGFRYVCAGCG